MILYPAIDLSGGRVVRLTQGDYARMDVYDDDPVAVARRFREAGATHLHVVDLDGAKDGAPRNADSLAAIANTGGLFVQTGGGIRTEERVEQTLALGVGRVILGTVALRDPALLRAMVRAHGDRIAVGVDARDGKVAIGGWLETTDTDAATFCMQLRDVGIATIVYTDIARDGGLGGPNLDAYRALGRIDGLSDIASGGISTEGDLEALREIGVSGAIVGKALYTGALDIARALAVCQTGEAK